MGPGLCLYPFFTNYYFPSPGPLCLVPDLGVGGGRAASRRSAHSPARVVGGKGGRSLFSCVYARSLIEATVAGALSRPSAVRSPHA